MRAIKTMALLLCAALTAAGASAADLRIGVASEVTTLDPHFFHLTSNTEIHKLIYSGLATQDADMRVIPDLAASWRTLDDTHWEFRLRPGIAFHDGSPMTADDVVFTYERARSVPNSPGSFLQYLKHVTKTIAVDPFTVLVETDGPIRQFESGGDLIETGRKGPTVLVIGDSFTSAGSGRIISACMQESISGYTTNCAASPLAWSRAMHQTSSSWLRPERQMFCFGK